MSIDKYGRRHQPMEISGKPLNVGKDETRTPENS